MTNIGDNTVSVINISDPAPLTNTTETLTVPIIDDKGEVLAAKIIVYAGENDEYYSFITPEAYNSLLDWIKFREEY